jgi:uncharacterized protein
MYLYRSLLAFALLIGGNASFSQDLKLIFPNEVFEQATVLGDSGNHAEAIKLLLQIPERDTAFTAMQLRSAYAYLRNKEYPKLLEVCNKSLSEPSENKAEYLKLHALATTQNGDYQGALALYDKAIKQYPADVMLRATLAGSQIDNKDYEGAVANLFAALRINPFHSSSHLNLARLAILQGRKVHGMLSLGMYLALAPKDNNKLVLLNNFVDNQLTDEGSIAQFGKNSVQKMDQMIRAKIAMEDDFKTMVPVSAPVTRQFELLFNQLGTIQTSPDDPYISYYLPLYKSIKEHNHVEAFIYHIITSAGIEAAEKWKKKNDKQLTEFFNNTNADLKKVREILPFPTLNFPSPANAWFDDANRLSAIGLFRNEKRMGHWLFLHRNGEKSGEGDYNDQGEKVGVWKYYHANGNLKSSENYETGEVTVFTSEGYKSEHFFLKNDEIDGIAKLFHKSGELRESITLKNGVREGKAMSYYADGSANETYNYLNGKLNGGYVSRYPNGKVKLRTTYLDDYYNGLYESYYSNGQVESSGQYAKGTLNGKWQHLHRNGQLNRTGSYLADGSATGEWVFYDHTGKLIEKRTYEKGELHGDVVFYVDGKPYGVANYKKGLLIRNTYYDGNQKVIFTAGNNDGTFYNKSYRSNGTLQNEGKFVKGKADGLWKYYDTHGNVIRVHNYKDDLLEGQTIDYFPTGEKKIETGYKDGKAEGHFLEYDKSGVIMQEGWYVGGSPEQRWLKYFPDGSMDEDLYLLGGETIGSIYNYSVDGAKYSETRLDKRGKLDELILFDSKGKVSSIKRKEKFNDVYEVRYKNQKLKMRSEFTSGLYTNRRESYYPDGTLYYSYAMVNDETTGKYIMNDVKGAIITSGQFEDNKKTGVWKNYYDNGKLQSIGNYFENEKDSIWTYYYEDGTVASRGPWKYDQKHGNFIYYNTEGNPVIEKMYQFDGLVAYRSLTGTAPGEWIPFKGTGRIEIKYANGKKALEQEYKRGELHGVEREYYSTGVLYSETPFDRGDFSGDYTVFYPTGKLKEKGSYKYDEYHGTVEFYDEAGQLTKSSVYRCGYRHGRTVIYEKGKKVIDYNFNYGFVED